MKLSSINNRVNKGVDRLVKVKDEVFHLTSILFVVLLSLLAWGFESIRKPSDNIAIIDFLSVLDKMPINEPKLILKPQEKKTIKSKSFYKKKTYTSKKKSYTSYPVVVTPKIMSIDLNSIDSTELESLPVFGPVLSSRTIKFRDALGGFVRVEQLKEIYGLDKESYDKAVEWFTVAPGSVVQLCADTASWYNMRMHPYFGSNGARMIERYRRHHKLYEVNDLRNMPQMNDSIWELWEPYLKICETE